jgi:hypothetical protein
MEAMVSGVQYKYLLSLPERVIRSLGALSGGLLRELGEVALPPGIRRTTLYRTMVGVTLRFLIEEVGQVQGEYDAEPSQSENFIVQRTASHGIEIMGILAFHASPVWVLAALADITGGGQALLQDIARAMKEEGLLDPDTRFETLEQVLGGLEKTSSHLAMTLNLPPVDVAGLRREWEQLKVELRSIPPSRVPALGRLEKTWQDLRASARAQDRTVLTMSSLMAISTLSHVPANLLWLSQATHLAARRTTETVGGAILDHYTTALEEIANAGFLSYWKREFRPYLRAAATQFAPQHQSLTERLLGRRAGSGGDRLE